MSQETQLLDVPPEDREERMPTPRTKTKKRKRDEHQPEGWRVKLYRLNVDGSWDDCGTGRISCVYKQTNGADPNSEEYLYQETGEATLCVQAEVSDKQKDSKVLLRTRILLRDAYQKQGDNIITWCEPYYNTENGVDLALSFQDNHGCLDIWKQITQVQNKAAEIIRETQRNVHGDNIWEEEERKPLKLPNPPTLANLEEIADTIATMQHVQQRNSLATFIARDECEYLRALLALFPQAEAKGDYGKLATLAACVKTILLINDPTILELIVTAPRIFEEVCTTLEYDPDLREKANHRWFLRERARFRTVVPMEDPELVSAIHRSFRVNYIRDTLLRPTMDESALSTLSSIQTISNADVIRGVTLSNDRKEFSLQDSYLSKVIKMLGVELHAICTMEWAQMDSTDAIDESGRDNLPDPSIVVGKHSLDTATWRQYLEPQDGSLSNRRRRRRGCLLFLRELFNMVRFSLAQSEKDDFFTKVCSLKIELTQEEAEIADNVSQTSQQCEVGSVTSASVASTIRSERLDDKPELPPHILQVSDDPVNLLSLLGNTLADPTVDTSERGAALEIIAAVAMHDASLIRFHCLEYHNNKMKQPVDLGVDQRLLSGLPDPNGKKQVLFVCPPNDLLAALLFQLDIGTDAGILLQVTEILRIILDTDTLSDHGPTEFTDEAELPPGQQPVLPHEQHKPTNHNGHPAASSTDQKQFLALFYENYVEWLVSPFQYKLLHIDRRIPDAAFASPEGFDSLEKLIAQYRQGVSQNDPMIKSVSFSSMRSSFVVELLGFCVRVHLYRMKFFLLKSRVLGSVLNLLRPRSEIYASSGGDRCLKLAALRFLRAILSVNDEFYHRHIIQNDLFEPVFEVLRENPVGDNLVSSAIVEMCDFIHSENIKSLLEYIVTKHINASPPQNEGPSLEDVSSPYVTTLTVLRKAYEANVNATKRHGNLDSRSNPSSPLGNHFFPKSPRREPRVLSGMALDDQRKFREHDEEEAYFERDDENEKRTAVPTAVDEVAAQETDTLHRTPRMFSLAQAPLLNNLEDGPARQDTPPPSEDQVDRSEK